MPTISRFYGITIQMFFKEHGVPHFHARYSGDSAKIEIATGEVIAGWLPGRALRLVREWIMQHPDELAANWERATRYEQPEQLLTLCRTLFLLIESDLAALD